MLTLALSIPRGNVEQVLLVKNAVLKQRRLVLTFNSPWECRIGLTGCSSVFLSERWGPFQFPVGMSNRSYTSLRNFIVCFTICSFNSPWECRIGLTLSWTALANSDQSILSIPRGNVEQVLQYIQVNIKYPEQVILSIPRGNVEQVLLMQMNLYCAIIYSTFNSPWECRIGLTHKHANYH